MLALPAAVNVHACMVWIHLRRLSPLCGLPLCLALVMQQKEPFPWPRALTGAERSMRNGVRLLKARCLTKSSPLNMLSVEPASAASGVVVQEGRACQALRCVQGKRRVDVQA